MPTLDELLGESPVNQGTTLDDYFDTSTITPSKPDFSIFDEPSNVPYLEGGDRNALYDFLGQGLWSFLDTAAFGVPSLLTPKELEETYLTPETGAGRVGSAIGGTIGFVAGGPMKLGSKAATLLARPFIKKAGAETVDQIVKKSAAQVAKTAHHKQFSTKAGANILNKEIGKRLSYLTHKTRWDVASKGVANNWGKSAAKAIDDIVADAVKMDKLTNKEAILLTTTFKKNIGTRPMQDFVDIMMKRNPNKWGWLAGNMVHEAAMFGMIDAAMEVSHSLNEDRPYDFMAPLWGVGVGGAFGALKLLPAAGKASITSEDFKSGVRSVFSKNYFKAMGKEKLILNSKIIGDTRKINNESSVINFKGLEIDLSNPISSIITSTGNKSEDVAVATLRKALNGQRVKYGREMMGAAVTEDFKSTLANWKRVIAGTAIMNTRMMIQMSQGAEMEPEDIATSILIGAFLNRRGRPLTPDMNMKKMAKIRGELHYLGEPQTRMLDIYPTLGRSQFEHINPITAEGFRGLRDKAEELELMADVPEKVEKPKEDGSPLLPVSEKSFPLFNEFYSWLAGASGKRWIKPKALITEKEAQEMQDTILQLEFEGKKIVGLKDFKEMMVASSEKITDNLEYETAFTLSEALNKSTDWTTLSASDETLGPIPRMVVVNQNLMNAVQEGKISYSGDKAPVSSERVHETLRKLNKLINFTDATMKAEITSNPEKQVVEIGNANQLRDMMESIQSGEARIDQLLNTSKDVLKFDFDALDNLEQYALARKYNKGVESVSNFFSDTNNPKWNELLNELAESGIVSRDPESLTGFRLNDFSKIDIVKSEEAGFKGDREESIVKSVISILGAKGNKSLPIDASPGKAPPITSDQIMKLEQYLNQNKVSTQKELLDMLRVNVTQSITHTALKNSKITGRDVSIITQLGNLETPFAKYSTMGDGGVGFTVSPIEVIGGGASKYKGWVNEYNTYIGHDAKDPDATIKGSLIDRSNGFVKKDRTIRLNDENDVRVFKHIIGRQEAAEAKRANEALFDFIQALDPQDNLKASIISYINKSETADDLLNFMLGNGLITTKSKKGMIEYIFNQKEFSNDIGRKKIADWLSRFGVHTSDIDKLMSAADVEIENYIDAKHKGQRGSFTQQQFFDKFFPAANGFGSMHQGAEVQEKFIKNNIYDSNGKVHADAHNNIISKMEVEITKGEPLVLGRELRKKHPAKYNQIKDQVQKLIALRHNSISKPVLSVSRGEIKITDKTMQKGAYTELLDKLGIPYVFVDGEMYAHVYTDRDIESRSINVLNLDSPHSTAGFHKNANAEAVNLRENFERLINTYDFEGAGTGAAMIRFGNAKNVTAVPKTSFAKVADLFNARIYDKYYDGASDAVKGQIEGMRRSLEASGSWGPVHVDAMRSIIIESMTKGKNDTRFLDYVEGSPDVLADLGKRFSLYHTPSFKRLDRDLMNSLMHASSLKDVKLLAKFTARDVGFVVWNDKDMASIRGRTKKMLADKQTSWEQMLGSRKDESSFDSITFISEDFKRILELYYGVSGEGSNVFKPIVSSNGEDYLMFAKTVFVHDPDIQAEIFAKKPDLDIMFTRTADKLKSSMSETEWANSGKPDRPIYMDKTVDQMLNITSKDLSQYMKTIPMEKIGVSIIPENHMLARQSYSIPNYMDAFESGEYYKAFYSDRLDRILGANQTSPGILENLVRNSMYKRLALLKLKGLDPSISFSELQGSPEGLEALGNQLKWASLGGDPRDMGENVLINTIKSQFLDPVLSPYSQTDVGDVYGGKSVIKQNFKFRDLDPTIRVGEKEDTKIYQGEIVLPYNARVGAINFKGKDLALKAIDKEGNDKDLGRALQDLIEGREMDRLRLKELSEVQKREISEDIEWMFENANLGEIHDELKRIDPNWSIGVLTTRYPRTTPNDLAVLRLKGFLTEKEGNTAVVNDFDVFNIFEGDYDVDEVDYFWAMNRGTWKHVKDQKRHWVNTVNTDHYKPKTPDLKLLDGGLSNAAWNQFDANNRVFKRGIGVAQKTVRLVNHVANLGVKNKETGMNDLMSYRDKNDEQFTISIDYDNKSFFERTALESQLIIDYWKGVSPDIVNNMVGHRNDYLFPIIAKSIHKGEVASLQERNQNHLALGPENNRIRVFRKYGPKTEDNPTGEYDLSAVDKTILQTLMSKHSKLLTLGTEVYDGSGQSRPPTYDNIIDISQKYFGHMKDITKSVFLAAKRKHLNDADFEAIFGKRIKIKRSALNLSQKLYGKLKIDHDEAIRIEQANKEPMKHTYWTYDRSPFLDGVISNGEQTQRSMGQHGSVVERIYREIMHRDPLGNDGRGGKSDVLLQGGLYEEMQFAFNEIMSPQGDFSGDAVSKMKEILPTLIKNVNDDIKVIKYYKKQIGYLIKNRELNQKTKDKRINALNTIIKEKESLLKDMLSTEYLEKGESKYLNSLKMVDITRDKDMTEGTIQWYTLHEMVEQFKPDHNLARFGQAISEARKLGAELYSEFNELGSSTPYGGNTLLRPDAMMKRMKPNDAIMDVEAKIAERLEEGYNEWGPSFLYEYAMPARDDGTVIGVFNGNPMPVTTKGSGRFKRTLRFLFDRHSISKDKEEKQLLKESLEMLATRSSAYRNFFDKNYGLIPLKDQDVFGVINNVPGFNKKIISTFDRYDTMHIEKGVFSRDVFGMGPEYDSHVSYYRRLVGEAFGSSSSMRFKQLEKSLSYTNQLVMENNYMNPMSYYLMTEKIRNDLADMGLDKAAQVGLEGNESNIINPHSTSPELAALIGRGNGVSIKPLGLLSDYRLNMLKKFIKQGVDIKKNQKRSEDWDQTWNEYEKTGYCKLY